MASHVVLKELVLISSELYFTKTSYCGRVRNRYGAGRDNYKEYSPISTKRANH